jgi:hypothetical protein
MYFHQLWCACKNTEQQIETTASGTVLFDSSRYDAHDGNGFDWSLQFQDKYGVMPWVWLQAYTDQYNRVDHDSDSGRVRQTGLLQMSGSSIPVI